MRVPVLPSAAVCLLAGLALVVLHCSSHPVSAASSDGPSYTTSGEMLPPVHYREWVYLSTGIDMSYTAKAGSPDHSMFDNVFVRPEAYRSFMETGAWPDKTVLVLEVREARKKGSINQRGQFQGQDLMGLEVHVKDEKRFPGKWAFFDFAGPDKTGALLPQNAACYSCHAQHAAVDTTFVQFYPTLLPTAQSRRTLSEAFIKESATVER